MSEVDDLIGHRARLWGGGVRERLQALRVRKAAEAAGEALPATATPGSSEQAEASNAVAAAPSDGLLAAIPPAAGSTSAAGVGGSAHVTAASWGSGAASNPQGSPASLMTDREPGFGWGGSNELFPTPSPASSLSASRAASPYSEVGLSVIAGAWPSLRDAAAAVAAATVAALKPAPAGAGTRAATSSSTSSAAAVPASQPQRDVDGGGFMRFDLAEGKGFGDVIGGVDGGDVDVSIGGGGGEDGALSGGFRRSPEAMILAIEREAPPGRPLWLQRYRLPPAPASASAAASSSFTSLDPATTTSLPEGASQEEALLARSFDTLSRASRWSQGFLRRARLPAMLQLHEEILDFVDLVAPTEEEVRAVCRAVCGAAIRESPSPAQSSVLSPNPLSTRPPPLPSAVRRCACGSYS